MSDSLRPHRWQPTRLLCSWGSPGKNTGVGCHFLLQCMKVKSESKVPQSCPICNQWTAAHKASLSMGFSRQGYSMVCHLLLQGIFPTQESNLGLLHCRQILYRVSYQGSPSPWPYIKPFFAPNSNLSVCLASLCARHKIRANTLGSE